MVQPTSLRNPLAHARQPLHIGGGCKLAANRSGNEAVLAVATNHCCHVAVNSIDTQCPGPHIVTVWPSLPLPPVDQVE